MRNARKLMTTGIAVLGVLAGMLFSAAPALAAEPPFVLVLPGGAKEVLTPFAAKLEVLVASEGLPTTCKIEYGKVSAGENEVPCEPASLEANFEEFVGTPLVNLEPNMSYQYRVVATNEAGETAKGGEFTTPANESVSGVTLFEATLNAVLNLNNQETTYFFEYSEKEKAGVLEGTIVKVPSTPGTIPAAFEEHPVNVPTGAVLKPATTYFYRVIAKNASKETKGKIESFTTAPEAPLTSNLAKTITATTAILEGTLNPVTSANAGWYFAYSTESKCTGNPLTSPLESEEVVQAKKETKEITELQPNKKYEFCLVATNAGGAQSTPGNEVSLMTSPAPPTLGVERSASVTSTAATLEAEVNPNNEPTNYTFEYSTTEHAGKLTGTPVKLSGGPLEGGSAQTASVPTVALLSPGTTYFYRVVAENARSKTEVKPVEGAVQSFTTVPTPHTEPVTAITATTATFNGTLTPLSSTVATEYFFDYNVGEELVCTGEHETAHADAGTGSGAFAVPATSVAELQPDQKYTVCLVSVNAFGAEVTTPPVRFSTLPAPPKVDSETSSAVTLTEATLEALVNPNNQETHAYLQYSTSATVNGSGSLTGATPTPTPPADLGEGFEDVQVAPPVLTGLTADQTYYYQAVATNATGTTYDMVQSFTTQGAPLVSTGEALNITRTTATLSGTVNPTGVETTYYFAYISEAGYQAALAKGAANPYAAGETTATVNAGSNDEPQTIAPTLASGLLPETTYHYALVAKNAVGVAIGPDRTLTALPRTPPIVSTGGASAVSQNSATLSGTVATNSLQTNYGFEIGTEPGNYGPATGLGGIGGAATETVSVRLAELQPGTTYYYRVTASNADGTSYGEPSTFTTPGFPVLLTAPMAPPLIATPAIAFPTGSQENTGTPIGTKKSLTRAQKLAAALKACRTKSKGKRAGCEKRARKQYAPGKTGATKKHNKQH
jgi:phosphodiesterase/alkaline phosphatase D-like protein